MMTMIVWKNNLELPELMLHQLAHIETTCSLLPQNHSELENFFVCVFVTLVLLLINGNRALVG